MTVKEKKSNALLLYLIIFSIGIIAGHFIDFKKIKIRNQADRTKMKMDLVPPGKIPEAEWLITSKERQELTYKAGVSLNNIDRKIKPENFRKYISENDVVGDLGSGHGYLLKALSQLVGKKGRVYSLDIDVDKLHYQFHTIQKLAENEGDSRGRYYENVIIRWNLQDDLLMPADFFDKLIIMDVHILHFIPGDVSDSEAKELRVNQEKLIEKIYATQKTLMESVYKSLKKDGRLIIVEARANEVALNEYGLIRLMKKFGFELLNKNEKIEKYQFLVFKKAE